MDCEVAIVGLGPTGAVLASLLSDSGIGVIVLERDAELHDLPRAVHFDGEVMRTFQAIGVADEVAGISRVNAGMRFVGADGRLLLDWPRPQEPGPHGWYPSYRFHQPDLDRILRAGLRRRGTELRLGVAAERIEPGTDAVRLHCSDGRSLTARYVVGCDGARSMVRTLIGGGAEDLGFHERWLVADLILHAERPDLGDATVQHCHPTRAVTQVRGPGLRRRWEIALREETDAEALDPDYLWRRLSDWISPNEARVERAAVYTFHSVIAERWRAGRLLIAGDAAHQTPPFMGQGMCAGVRDAANLAWKLAAVIRDGADPTLLDTYQTERAPNVRSYIDMAVRLGRLINATDPEGALKDAFLLPDGSRRITTPEPALGPGFHSGTPAGRLFPQFRLSDGRRMDDVAGYRSVLLRRGEGDGQAGVLDETMVPGLDATLDQLGCDAVMLRPDRILFGTADGNSIADLTARYAAALFDPVGEAAISGSRERPPDRS